MTADFLYRFISKHKMAVLATVSKKNTSESALVGISVTPALEIIFDTVKTSRKYKNLVENKSVSFVIGWDDEQTLQYEGIAKIPTDQELENLLPQYFKVFPDGVERKQNWKDLVYFYVKPKWIRYSDFSNNTIEEIEIDKE